MANARDFYEETDNEKRAEEFAGLIGVEKERAKVIFLDLFLYAHGMAVLNCHQQDGAGTKRCKKAVGECCDSVYQTGKAGLERRNFVCPLTGVEGRDMKTDQYLIDFYNQYDEDSRLAPRHGSVEFLTTMRYIEKYIRPGHRVLEVGAGTGRYSHALAGRGYAVDAVELVEHNIEIFRQNTRPGEPVTNYPGKCHGFVCVPGRCVRHRAAVGAAVPPL